MKILFFALILISQAWGHEKNFRTSADAKATARYRGPIRHPWPFTPLSIGHNMQSYQDYSGDPYWHDGLDIRANPNQPIYAAAGGKVVNIENYVRGDKLYWEVAILDQAGFVWKYHHVAQETITAEIKNGYKTGTPIQAGTHIGNVVRWPISSFGEVYDHLHLLVVASNGLYINPFLMMERIPDTVAPVISKIGIAINHRPVAGNEVRGPHALFLEASDLTLHRRFLLPPYRISYRLDHGQEKVVWEFVSLPSGKNDKDYINDFYMIGTCGNYQCRRFFFNLNFSIQEPRGLMNLQPGMHGVEVTVQDAEGNKTSQSYSWRVL